ncbi:MAG: hypothetical protein K9N51_14095 [Candidatus Pacebacteria bacterium]|nr:hypothetical protein [Candidatus Paceibacterota bacterium]
MTEHKVHLQYEIPYADTDRMGMIYYANYNLATGKPARFPRRLVDLYNSNGVLAVGGTGS